MKSFAWTSLVQYMDDWRDLVSTALNNSHKTADICTNVKITLCVVTLTFRIWNLYGAIRTGATEVLRENPLAEPLCPLLSHRRTGL